MKHSCLHTHTVFCDGKDGVETMCRAAAKKGLVSIGFSSHAPVARKIGEATSWHMKEEELGRYIEEVNAAKKRWQGRLEVYLGLEVDYIKGICGPADRDIRELELDYCIGSVHYISAPGGRLFTVDAPEEEFRTGFSECGNDGKMVYSLYFQAYRAMIEEGGFDIAGHLDLIKKNNGRIRFFSDRDPDYLRQIRETAGCLAVSSVVELNTGGLIRGYTEEPYPSGAILRLLHDRRIGLTISADAHSAEQMGGHYADAVQAALNAGYASTLLFAGRKDGTACWTEESLRLQPPVINR